VNLKFDLDTVQFRAAANRAVTELGANAQELLKEETRFAIRDFAKVTPPFAAGSFNSSMGSAADKKAGENAIKKDLSQIASSAEQGFLQFVADKFGTTQIKQQLFKKGSKKPYLIDWDKIAFTVAELMEFHKKKRNRYGRTPTQGAGMGSNDATIGRWKSREKLIVPTAVYTDYLKSLLSRVGREKNTFGLAAARLGLELPLWVRKQGLIGAGGYYEGNSPSFFILISGKSQRPQAPQALADVMKKRGEILAKEVQRLVNSFARTGKILTRRKSFNSK
jgi:hypothetical protein